MSEDNKRPETPPDHPTGGVHKVYTGTFTRRRKDFPLGKVEARIARRLDELDERRK